MSTTPGQRVRVTVTVVVTRLSSDHDLPTTLASVLAQRFGDFEVIVVHGITAHEAGPPPKTNDPRVRHIYHAGATRPECQNLGIQLAEGRMIAFIQPGDRWLPEKLHCHVEQLNCDHSLGVVYSYTQLETSRGTPIGLLQDEGQPQTRFAELIAHDVIGHGSNAVVRAEVFTERTTQQLTRFDPQMRTAAEYELWCRIALRTTWKFACAPRVLVCHRLMPPLPKRQGRAELHTRLLALGKTAALAPETVEHHRHRAVAQFFWHRALRLAVHHDIEAARVAIRIALEFDRTSLSLNRALLTAAVISLRRFGPRTEGLVRAANQLWRRWQTTSNPLERGKPVRRLLHTVHTRSRTKTVPVNYARPNALANLFTICHRHRTMFVNVSKNASSSLKHTFYREEFGAPSPAGQGIHAVWGFSPSPGRVVELHDEEGLAPYRDYLRFAVYRDPVSRLLSAYHNKVLYPPNDHTYYVTRRLYGVGIEKFIRVAEQVVQLENPLHMDEHLRPQYQFYTPDEVDYIVPIQHLEHFLWAKFAIRSTKRHNRVSMPKLQINAEQAERIRSIYARDYAIQPNWPE